MFSFGDSAAASAQIESSIENFAPGLWGLISREVKAGPK